MLHVADLDLADALRQPERLEASANGSTVWKSPFSNTIAGLLHSSMVVQTLKPKLMPVAPGDSRLLPSRMPM